MPSLETLKARLLWALSNLIQVKVSLLIGKELNFKSSFHPKPFCDSIILFSSMDLHISHQRNSNSSYLSVHQKCSFLAAVMGKACVGPGLWLSSSAATFFFERDKIPSSHFMTPFEFHGVGSMIRFCFLYIE